MGQLGREYPKCLLPYRGASLLETQISQLERAGVEEIIVVVGHLRDAIEAQISRSVGTARVRFVVQDTALGLAHAVSLATPLIRGGFFVSLGDLIYPAQAFHGVCHQFESTDADGVIVCERGSCSEKVAKNFAVYTDGQDRVTALLEKPRVVDTDIVGIGLYAFSEAFLDVVTRTPRTALRDEYELAESLELYLRKGAKLSMVATDSPTYNVTSPTDVLRINLNSAGETGWLSPSANVSASAELRRSVVLHDAEIGSNAVLDRVLVMPGARIAEGQSVSDSIVTPTQIVPCDIP